MFKDHFTKSSSEYSRFRPNYPDELFRYLVSISPNRGAAWDCATGNGQAAAGAAPYFNRVVATDASKSQVRNAMASGKVVYMVSLSEDVALKDRSIDVAMAAQAAHWFDLPRFYSEVRRILRPGGIIAIWCYSLLRIDPGIDRVIEHLYSAITGPYWPPERKLIDEQFRSIFFPFHETSPPEFEMVASWDFNHLAGYLGTWSAVNRFREATGDDPLGLIHADLARAWGDVQSRKRVRWPIHMRVGRI